MSEEDGLPDAADWAEENMVGPYGPSIAASSGGWKTPPNPQYHDCLVPVFGFQDAGRPWECGVCGALWTLHRDYGQNAPRLPRFPVPLPGGMEQHPEIPWVSNVPIAELRYTPTDLTAPAGENLPLPDGNVTLLSEHSKDCAHRTGKGMCSCKVRHTV